MNQKLPPSKISIAKFHLVHFLTLLFLMFTGAAAFSQPPSGGNCRNSLFFDGVDDHLTTSVTAFNYGSGTFEVWVKKENWSSANDEVLLGNGLANNVDNCIYFSLHPSVGLHFRYGGYPNQVGNTYASSGLSAITSLAAGSWHHIAATWSYSNPTTTIIVYLDGVQVGTSTTNLLITSTNNLFFGKNPSAAFFGGQMAELRLWNVAKSAATIANAKDNILIGNETNLIGYWPLTEPAGATAANLVAGGNVATLTNMNTVTAWTNIPKAGCSAQSITFNAFNNPNLSETPITPSASASSGLSLTYSSSNTAVATVSENTISPLTVGSTTIKASQPGNSSYYPAVPLEQNLDVKGLFTSYFSLAGPYHNRSVMADFDKDGDLDFFIANSSRQSPTTSYLNGTTGAMGPITGNGQKWWRYPEISFYDRTAIGLSDFNKDGNLDLMVGGYHFLRDANWEGINANMAPSTRFWFGGYSGFPYDMGKGAAYPFYAQSDISQVTSTAEGNAAFGDYDNDGNDDMLLTGIGTDVNYSGEAAVEYIIATTRIWHNMGNSFPSPQNNRDGNNNFTDQTSTMAPSLPDKNGAVAWCDYDNDGDLDFLYMFEATKYSYVLPRAFEIWRNGTTGANGVFTNQTSEIAPSAISVGYGTTIAWGDYDNDGDMDFVLSGSDKTALFRNGTTGAMGTFTDQTATIAPSLASFKSEKGSIVWGDHDNDGDLDLLLTGNNGKIFQNGTTGASGTFTDQTTVLLGAIDNIKSVESLYYADDNSRLQESVGYNSGTWGDIDNDGDLDILITGKTANLYKNETTVANTAPSVPTGLVPTLSGTTVTFNWTASTDNTTPSVALTYNVSVGTTAGGRNVVSPNALNSGFLTTPAWGNAGQGTNFILKNLTPGTTYYWTVQAIDNGLNGSAFATEGSFCVPPAAPTGLASQTFCNSATVANLAATGTAIKWYAAANGGTALASTTALANGTTYYATQTISCESSARFAVTISIEGRTVVTAVTQPTIATATGTISVTAQNPGNETYSFDNGSTFQASNSKSGLAAGTYNVIIKSAGGCSSTATLATVNAQPTIQVDTFDPQGDGVPIATYTVPAGVFLLKLETWGSDAGVPSGNDYPLGSGGGYAKGDMLVSPGQVLQVFVGDWYGYNGFRTGGGKSDNINHRGGGASDVRIYPYGLSDRVIVAGGSGAGYMVYSSRGGAGGGGTVGPNYAGGGGGGGYDGGTAGAPGGYAGGAGGVGDFSVAGIGNAYESAGGGGGGYVSGGRAAQDSYQGVFFYDGTFGIGGGYDDSNAPYGGAGGGGYYGGGSGAGRYSGGGGGSSYVGSLTNTVMQGGVRKSQEGLVVITVLSKLSITQTCTGNTSSLTAVMVGGTAPFTYSWSPSGGTNATATGLSAGNYTATVTDANSVVSTLSYTIAAAGAAPQITSITQPTCTSAAGTITVTAQNAGNEAYSFDNGVNFQASNLKSGLAAGDYTVVIKNAGGCNSSVTAATVNAQPTTPTTPVITSITQPTCATATGTITVTQQIAGEMYSFDNGVNFQSSNSKSGLAAGSYNVIIKSAGGCSSTATPATMNAQPATPTTPVIASITQPTCSTATGTITVTAQNAGETYSFDNGVNFQASNSKSGLTAGTYNVILKSAGGCSSTSTQTTIEQSPVTNLTSFTPTAAASGTTVTITGTNLDGATAVNFGGVAAASFTVVSATRITAVVATGASGNVSVTTSCGTITSSGFTFTAAPATTIASFAPSSAASGATVTITGSNFTGATAVSFGGTAASSFTVVSSTSITAIVASGSSGNLSVTTPGGTATRAGFTFIAPVPPSLSYVTSPSDNATNVSTTANITALSLSGATSYNFQLSKTTDFATIDFESTRTVNNATFSGLAFNTTYFTRVRTNLSSVFGLVRSFTTTNGLFSNLTSPANNANNVSPTANITALTLAGATSYTFQLSRTADFATVDFQTTRTVNNATFTGLAFNTQYFNRVTTNVSNGFGQVQNFTTTNGLFSNLTLPANNATNVSTSVTLNAMSLPGATSYTFELSRTADFATIDFQTTRTVNNATFTGLTFNTTYFNRVTTNVSNGFGQVQSFTTTNGLFSNVTTPANNATNVSTTAALTALNVSGASSYTFQLSRTADFAAIDFQSTRTVNYLTFTGLAFNTRYYNRVTANVSNGFGSVLSFTTTNGTFSFVTTPADNAINVSTASAGVIALTVSGATSYITQLSRTPDFSTIDFQSTRTVNYNTFSGLLVNTRYYNRVRTNLSSGFGTVNSFVTRAIAGRINSDPDPLPEITADLKELEVSMYPNPFTDKTTLYIESVYSQAELSIVDMNGRTLHRSIEDTNKSIPLNQEIPAGVYSLYVKAEGKSKLIRVVKY